VRKWLVTWAFLSLLRWGRNRLCLFERNLSGLSKRSGRVVKRNIPVPVLSVKNFHYMTRMAGVSTGLVQTDPLVQ